MKKLVLLLVVSGISITLLARQDTVAEKRVYQIVS
jgi:hypothetical protein